jgi:hypothetical protein
MNSEVYDDLVIEEIAAKQFGIKCDIKQVIVRDIPVSRTARATVFLTTKKQLYCIITGQSKLLLGDIKKMVTRMGLIAELFIPPKGRPTYFDDIAREHFKRMYPGRSNPSPDDLRFYLTLAPYNPALVQILEIKHGEIHQYDTDSRGSWRVAKKFAYRRIKTS